MSLQQAFRLNIQSGKVEGGYPVFDHMPALRDPLRKGVEHYCYMFERDADDNFLCTDGWGSNIMYVDTKTGKSTAYPTPTPWAFPRRGYIDDGNRFWFTEFYADKIGVFDITTKQFKEFTLPVKYISPYYARPDSNGNIWISSNGSDRLIRLDPNTGKTLFYMIPVYYDARKVVVDSNEKMTTIWLPNKNTAQLIKVEVPN